MMYALREGFSDWYFFYILTVALTGAGYRGTGSGAIHDKSNIIFSLHVFVSAETPG
jgi:hypothetical protein